MEGVWSLAWGVDTKVGRIMASVWTDPAGRGAMDVGHDCRSSVNRGKDRVGGGRKEKVDRGRCCFEWRPTSERGAPGWRVWAEIGGRLPPDTPWGWSRNETDDQ